MVYLHAAPIAMQAQYRFFAPCCSPFIAASRQQAHQGKREALRVGIPGGVLKSLLAGICGSATPLASPSFRSRLAT